MADLNEGGVNESGTMPEERCGGEGPNAHPCPVVAIGASAGGLEAFQELLRRMPADTGYAFVLIQHLSPRHETLMPELLSRLTSMPVKAVVADETVIEANHVYVMPPNVTLTVDDCVLYVSKPARTRGRRSPIDRFFRSLAEDQEDEAVAILLSGTGTDGALGLKTVKERGGFTMVQTPETARYDSMPRSAILTGAVDYVVPVEEMPARLVEHQKRLRDGQGGNPERFREEISGYLGKICAILRRQTGHDFRQYKQSTLVRRVRRRMNEMRNVSVYAYAEYLNQDPREAEQLFRDLLISVTHFFRDPEVFALLAARVIPRLFEGKDSDGFVRVWVPGCATGEEAYSIAMLLREHMDGLEAPPQVQVFASDIDAQAIETARQALYPETIAGQIPPERLERFFVKHGNMLQVSREIRDLCLFSLHNLIADPPFSRLDLVSCRNLLIYLESELQKKVIALFHYALRPGGILLLGPSEMVASELFRTLDKKLRLFQARDTVARPPFSFPLSERGRLLARPAEEPQRRAMPRQQEVARTFETVLLENYAPACVVVNEWGDITYFSPRTGRYLEPPPGTPTVNVIDMARKGLRLDVRTALHKAVNARVPVVHENVAFELDGQTQRVNVVVRPLPELGEDSGLFMVVFQDAVTVGDGAGELEPDPILPDDPMVRRLEAELRSTKDHLQATLEELESSNEELVSSNEELLSMNEELQSANEELQTSKEELQSVNEELETVNTELKKKVEELDQANSDLQNLFQSTRIATLFVDRELRIKKFTPAAVEVFRLIDGDIGRPIADIAPRFRLGDLVGDIREVLRTLATHERQVKVEDGSAWYLLRILPYRTIDDVIDGVVLTLIDITALKRAEEDRAKLAAIVESSQDGIIGKTLDGVITSWNAGAEKMYGYTAQEAIGRPVDLIVAPECRAQVAGIFEQLRQGIKVEPFETARVRKDGQRLDVSITFSPVRDSEGRLVGASGIDRDISDRKRAEQQILRSQQELTDFLENASVGLHWVGPDGIILWANRTEMELLGYSREEYIGRHIAEFHADPLAIEDILQRLSARETLREYEARMVCKDGSTKYVVINSNVLWENDRFVHTRCFTRDISDRKRAEEALREEARRKDEFLAMLGHELRNPLAPIRNCLTILQSPAATARQKEEAFKTAERQVHHLTRLVDDLLDISRISRGKILLKRERLDLVDAVRATAEDQRIELETAGLDLEVGLPGSPIWVEGDLTRLSQTVSNVLHNAGKFTEPGGRIEVSVRAEPERGTAVVRVRDTGIGMQPELLARVFEPFSQADRGPDRSRGGLGLGLSLVKALVELHGGSVEAASPGLGRGSEVTIRFPLLTGAEDTDAMADPPREEPAPVRRCLVIEDNVDAAESMALLLNLDGHETEVAFDAAGGLEKARRFHPEVVLCDIGLPGPMDGHGLARAFRADPELREAYLIALTGYGQEEDRRRALEAGFDAHLTKPADLDVLRRLLAAAG
ncbi:MAG TPA: chemotaxis protein CheB [Thermoanaerobaculia bacterium]|jgi:two-component system CheB/CheR fusion protein|nr:chemotaxis protein CheB [Thermoanaerobaculia bacterium]